MREIGRNADLSQEALGPERGGQLGPQDLDRDLAMVLQVLSEIVRRHPASTDLVLDGVAVREGGFEAVEKLWHCVWPG